MQVRDNVMDIYVIKISIWDKIRLLVGNNMDNHCIYLLMMPFKREDQSIYLPALVKVRVGRTWELSNSYWAFCFT